MNAIRMLKVKELLGSDKRDCIEHSQDIDYFNAFDHELEVPASRYEQINLCTLRVFLRPSIIASPFASDNRRSRVRRRSFGAICPSHCAVMYLKFNINTFNLCVD